MLTKSALFTLTTEDSTLDIMITPLFLQNHGQPWQPNEIYSLSQVTGMQTNEEPADLGKIIVDEEMNWHYDGDFEFTDAEKEQIARFVLSQI